MATISLKDIRHSYDKQQESLALKEIDITWEDGGAYALLGPSGCGKTTLLNIISGLLRPSHGRVHFDAQDVTDLSPERRNIAQVFQFPVIYDTMRVYDNLAFPLRNRGYDRDHIDRRVHEIAELLELKDLLMKRAHNLSADNKQKISLGRGLVRDHVDVIMFDEPLTTIDPHLKWTLRAKLKELHQRLRPTMIYVTHDQTEALTFADKVVVMNNGEIIQEGTPVELFEKPKHTFIGYFIGSPGMNVLPCTLENGNALFEGSVIALDNVIPQPASGRAQIGIRPEFVSLGEQGILATVRKVTDVGRHLILEAVSRNNVLIRAILKQNPPQQGDSVRLTFQQSHTHLYLDGWLVCEKSNLG